MYSNGYGVVREARCKYDQRERMVNGIKHSRVNHNATTVPKAMLTKTGLKPINSVRPIKPKRNFFKRINTAKEKINTARPNSAVLNAVRVNKGKAGHSHKQIEDQGYFDNGCSRHITGNVSYLTDIKEFDRGYVAFRGGAKGGKITGKDEVSTTKMHDGLGRATTTVSSLGAEQGSGGPGCHFSMGDSRVQAKLERLSNSPNEPPLKEDKVTHLENKLTSTKVVYNKALITPTKRVKKLEKKLKNKRKRVVIDSSKEVEASLDHEDSPKQGRMIKEINKDENVNLVKSSKQREPHKTAEHIIDFSTASPQTDDDETLAETLLNIKKSASKDKGKAIIQESESPKKIKKKEMMQISLDEEIAQRFYEEEET
nr:hypothetical protein [Tanacetum cinerariifolium]